MLRREQRIRNIILYTIFSILFIGVGYAMYSIEIDINGVVDVDKTNWNIYLDNLNVLEESNIEGIVNVDSKNTALSYNLTLQKPGDRYKFSIDVVNDGTIDAMIENIIEVGLTQEQQQYINYSIKYKNGRSLSQKDALYANSTNTIVVDIEYKYDIEAVNEQQEDLELSLDLNYIKADGTEQDIKTYATLKQGSVVNPILKTIAHNTNPTSSTADTNVKKILRAEKIDSDYDSTKVDISKSSSYPIYCWFDDSTQIIYYQTDADLINIDLANSLFAGFTEATEIDVKDFYTKLCTGFNNMFGTCKKLDKVDVSGFETSRVSNFSMMFYNCTSLKDIDISNFDYSVATNLASFFNNCTVLENLKIGKINSTKNVVTQQMFSCCQSLETIDLSIFEGVKLSDTNNMFNKCQKVKELNVSYLDTSDVKYMNNMFYGCEALEKITFGNFSTANATNMLRMFYNCKSLKNLDLSGFVTSNVTTMQSMFDECSALENLNVSNFTIEKVLNMNSMFRNCSKLTTINLSSFSTSVVANIGYMFCGCSSLTTLNLGNFDTSHVTAMSAIFKDCTSLKTLDLSMLDTNAVNNITSAFDNMTNIETIYVSYKFVYNSSSITNIFGSDTKLVGGNGTRYDTNVTNYQSTLFAKPDGYSCDYDTGVCTQDSTVKGYFTLKTT